MEVVEAVQAVQRCFGEDVQQCLDACPRSLRVRNRERYVSQVNAVRQTDGPRRVPQRSKDLIQMVTNDDDDIDGDHYER